MTCSEKLCPDSESAGLRAAFLRCGFLVDAEGVIPEVDAVLTVADYASFGLAENDLFALESVVSRELAQQEVITMCRALIAGTPLETVRFLGHHEIFQANHRTLSIGCRIFSYAENLPEFWGPIARPLCLSDIMRLAETVVRYDKMWFEYPNTVVETAIWAYEFFLNEQGLSAWLTTDIIYPFMNFYPLVLEAQWIVDPSPPVRSAGDLVKQESMNEWAVWGSSAYHAGLSLSEAIDCYCRVDRPSVGQLGVLASLRAH